MNNWLFSFFGILIVFHFAGCKANFLYPKYSPFKIISKTDFQHSDSTFTYSDFESVDTLNLSKINGNEIYANFMYRSIEFLKSSEDSKLISEVSFHKFYQTDGKKNGGYGRLSDITYLLLKDKSKDGFGQAIYFYTFPVIDTFNQEIYFEDNPYIDASSFRAFLIGEYYINSNDDIFVFLPDKSGKLFILKGKNEEDKVLFTDITHPLFTEDVLKDETYTNLELSFFNFNRACSAFKSNEDLSNFQVVSQNAKSKAFNSKETETDIDELLDTLCDDINNIPYFIPLANTINLENENGLIFTSDFDPKIIVKFEKRTLDSALPRKDKPGDDPVHINHISLTENELSLFGESLPSYTAKTTIFNCYHYKVKEKKIEFFNLNSLFKESFKKYEDVLTK